MDKYSDLLQTLLKNRGIKTTEDADSFLNPDYDLHTHNPFLMKDMDLAVERILLAIKNGEKIAIYGDFDADGIPASVLLHDFFKKVGHANFINYIPHRDEEGYGFHKEVIDKFSKESVSLVITVDVGIADIKTVDYASTLGIDCIITDHHEPKETLPKALAVLDPKRKDCEYPFSELCGTGVAYKLVQAIFSKAREKELSFVKDIKIGWEKWLLDLVAIATIADMVPLIDENRVLARWGLFVLRRSKRSGLLALCKKVRIKQNFMTEDDIAFMIAPRINAASRMGSPEDAFTLLSTNDDAVAEDMAKHLQNLNNRRKGVVSVIVKKLKSRFSELEDLPEVLLAGNPEWNPALLGLAASSLVDEYKRPACVWGRDGTGTLKGSCRSDGTVSIVKMLEEASDKLLAFGGHAGAGGFSVDIEHVHSLSEILSKAYLSVKESDEEKSDKLFDKELKISDVSYKTHKELSMLAPFGVENPKPVFLFKDVQIHSIKHFGKDNNHLELIIIPKNNNGAVSNKLRAYNFFTRKDSYSRELSEGLVIDLFATIERSLFRGVTIELRIVNLA